MPIHASLSNWFNRQSVGLNSIQIERQRRRCYWSALFLFGAELHWVFPLRKFAVVDGKCDRALAPLPFLFIFLPLLSGRIKAQCLVSAHKRPFCGCVRFFGTTHLIQSASFCQSVYFQFKFTFISLIHVGFFEIRQIIRMCRSCLFDHNWSVLAIPALFFF